jgi:hypothetical protein
MNGKKVNHGGSLTDIDVKRAASAIKPESSRPKKRKKFSSTQKDFFLKDVSTATIASKPKLPVLPKVSARDDLALFVSQSNFPRENAVKYWQIGLPFPYFRNDDNRVNLFVSVESYIEKFRETHGGLSSFDIMDDNQSIGLLFGEKKEHDIILGSKAQLRREKISPTALNWILTPNSIGHRNEELVAKVFLDAVLNGFSRKSYEPHLCEALFLWVDESRRQSAANLAVYYTAFDDNPEFLDFLLTRWKNPNAADYDHGSVEPALTAAIYAKRLENVKVFLKHGADPLFEPGVLANKIDDIESPWKEIFTESRSGPNEHREEIIKMFESAIRKSGRPVPTRPMLKTVLDPSK